MAAAVIVIKAYRHADKQISSPKPVGKIKVMDMTVPL